MSKHTPGPWTAQDWGIYAKGKDFNPALHNGKTCQECGHDESECYDFDVILSLSVELINDIKNGHWDNFKNSEKTSKADLRLIAAAPDLLEVLIALERTAGTPAMKNNPVRVKARAAIAKAIRGAL